MRAPDGSGFIKINHGAESDMNTGQGVQLNKSLRKERTGGSGVAQNHYNGAWKFDPHPRLVFVSGIVSYNVCLKLVPNDPQLPLS